MCKTNIQTVDRLDRLMMLSLSHDVSMIFFWQLNSSQVAPEPRKQACYGHFILPPISNTTHEQVGDEVTYLGPLRGCWISGRWMAMGFFWTNVFFHRLRSVTHPTVSVKHVQPITSYIHRVICGPAWIINCSETCQQICPATGVISLLPFAKNIPVPSEKLPNSVPSGNQTWHRTIPDL